MSYFRIVRYDGWTLFLTIGDSDEKIYFEFDSADDAVQIAMAWADWIEA